MNPGDLQVPGALEPTRVVILRRLPYLDYSTDCMSSGLDEDGLSLRLQYCIIKVPVEGKLSEKSLKRNSLEGLVIQCNCISLYHRSQLHSLDKILTEETEAIF